jgi:hypothetical protein
MTPKEKRQRFLAEHGDRIMAKFRELGSALKVEKALKLSPLTCPRSMYHPLMGVFKPFGLRRRRLVA